MPPSLTKTVAVGLALGWLILSGAVYPATVPHALHHAQHHAHHHASTHSSGLCSWLCAAGQTADVAALFDPALSTPVGSADQTALVLPPLLPSQPFLSRGPPSFLNS
jgi:hypothetical protein